MTEQLTVITNWLRIMNDLKFCEEMVKQINKNPDRQASIERRKTLCRVVDSSIPIKAQVYTAVDGGYNVITGWEPSRR